MALVELGIEHKGIPATLVACVRFNLKGRSEVAGIFEDLACAIPEEQIAGPPYLILQYFSSYTEGYEAEAGFPVKRPFEDGWIKSKLSPAMEVLSVTHRGAPEGLRESRGKLSQFSRKHALISDEFTREVYPDWPNPEGAIELQFVIHPWNALFAENLERALGTARSETVLAGAEALTVMSTPEQRFRWAKAALEQLDKSASEQEQFEVLSRCAHVYPPGQLEKLKRVYNEARSDSDDPLVAVDAVRAFMRSDPGWNDEAGYRQGHVVYHTKNPADPEAYEQAKTAEEKRAAYCFCPVIRERLDGGMPTSYCYCGAGWYRQQWETATGKPVRVEVVQSVLRGNEVCQFAVHLAEDL